MGTRRRLLGHIVLAVFLLLSAFKAEASIIKVLHNGKVFTGVAGAAPAEGLVTFGSIVVDVGTNADVLRWAGLPNVQVIDLGGRTVIPGINDAHVHVLPISTLGPLVIPPDFAPGPGPTMPEVLNMLAAEAARQPGGGWLFGVVGQNFTQNPDANRFTLDKVTPNNPVVLLNWTGHPMYINTAAMKAVGLSEMALNPFGGEYYRVPGTDVINGVLVEYAGYNFWRRMRAVTPDSVIQGMTAGFLQAAATLGITSVQDFPVGLPYDRIQRILKQMPLTARYRVICVPMSPDESRNGCTPDPELLNPTGRLIASGVKWITDGTPANDQGAALREEYSNRPGWFGWDYFPEGIIDTLVGDALFLGNRHHHFDFKIGPSIISQRLFHACGDRAIQNIIDAMDNHQWSSAGQHLRMRIEHGDITGPDQIPALARNRVTVVQSPTHLATPILLENLGPQRSAVLQPVKSLLQGGALLAFGSDSIGFSPVVANPFVNLMLAMVHPNNPSEAITLEQALTAYTRGAAYAEGLEDVKGTLQPGKLADLAVLSQDIFTVPPPAIAGTQSVLTIVGGEVVYNAGVL